MSRDQNPRAFSWNAAIRLIPLLLAAGLVQCGGKSKESSPAAPASPAVSGPAAPPDMTTVPAPDMAPPPAVPERAPEYVGGWLDAQGKEVLRLPEYRTFQFVAPDLASACKYDQFGFLRHCVVVDRAGRVGKELAGPLVVALQNEEKKPLYQVEMDRGQEKSPYLGVLGPDLEPILFTQYASIDCVASCRSFITLEKDDSDAMHRRNQNYSVPVNEYTYRLHDRRGSEMKVLLGPAVVGAEIVPDFVEWLMTPAGGARLAPFRRKNAWGLVNLAGKVVMEPTHEVLRTLPSGAALIGAECNENYLMSDYVSCKRWEVLDPKGQTLVGPVSRLALPIGREMRNLVLYNENSCVLFKEDGTPVTFEGCDGLLDLPSARRVAFLNKESGLWGLADDTGKTLVEPTWRHVGRRGLDDRNLNESVYGEPEAGLIPVMTRDASGIEQEGAVDLEGKVVIDLKWERVWHTEDLVYVRSGGKWGVLDRAGTELLSPRYEKLERISTGGDVHYFPVQDGKNCHVTPKGVEVLCGTDDFLPRSRHHLIVEKNKKRYLHAYATGKQLVEPPLPKKMHGLELYVDRKARTIAWASETPEGRVLYALVGPDGPLTPFRYSELGAGRPGFVSKSAPALTPFFIDNRKPVQPKP
mgnify:CR=1 FL=1